MTTAVWKKKLAFAKVVVLTVIATTVTAMEVVTWMLAMLVFTLVLMRTGSRCLWLKEWKALEQRLGCTARQGGEARLEAVGLQSVAVAVRLLSLQGLLAVQRGVPHLVLALLLVLVAVRRLARQLWLRQQAPTQVQAVVVQPLEM
jgi:hypothetical protein